MGEIQHIHSLRRDQDTTQMSDYILFYINDRRYKLHSGDFDPYETLASFIRNQTQFTGTKASCLEGGCGACAVLACWYPCPEDATTDSPVYRSINACLRPLGICDGMLFVTTEGIGNRPRGYHKVQKQVAECNGSQCGFCTPGMVMSLFSYLVNNKNGDDPKGIESAVDGNICRCTGYRPIVQAAHALVKDPSLTNPGIKIPREIRDHVSNLPTLVLHRKRPDEASGEPVNIAQDNEWGSDAQDDEWVSVPSGGVASSQWIRPVSFDQVAKIMTNSAKTGDIVKLVNGRTSYGVAKSQIAIGNTSYAELAADCVAGNNPALLVDLRSVAELHELGRATKSNTASVLRFGSSITISQVLDTFASHAKSHPEGTSERQVLDSVASQLHRVAGHLVRNVGTWAGNIVLAKEWGFASDLATIFTALGARVELFLGEEDRVVEITLEDFLHDGHANSKYNVLKTLEVPYPGPGDVMLSYKSALRFYNAHALINASMFANIDKQNKTIRSIRVVYGGLGGNTSGPVRAEAIEALLANTPISEANMKAALSKLKETVVPLVKPLDVYKTVEQPQGKLRHRQSLVTGFLFKFYVHLMTVCDVGGLPASTVCAGQPFDRPAMSATETFENPDPAIAPVGQPLPKLSAYMQAAGEAKYVNDIRNGGSESTVYHGAMVCNTEQAVGVLTAIDVTEALKLDGVVTFVDASDIPGENDIGQFTSVPVVNEPVFVPVGGKVSYIGQPVGVIIARDAYVAENAARLVKVVVANPHNESPVLSIEEAIRRKARIPFDDFPSLIETGDVDRVLKDGTLHQETKRLTSGSMIHFYMEKQSTLAVPDEDRIVVDASTQNLRATKQSIVSALACHPKKVTVKVRRTGGAFGGKISRSINTSVAACVAANKLNVPVKIFLDIHTDQQMTGGRAITLVDVDVAFDDRGKIHGLQIDSALGGGAFPDATIDTLTEYAVSLDQVYFIENYRAISKAYSLNVAPRTSVRAPGHMQSSFIMESIMDFVAERTGLDPVLVRERNMYSTRNAITPYNQPIFGLEQSLPRVWAGIKSMANYDELAQNVDEFNHKNKWRKRGVAVVPVKYGVDWVRAGALVSVDGDGAVHVTHSGVEVGQGIHTRVAQVAAFTLNAPMEAIRVADTSTDILSNIMVTGGSVATGSSCEAVRLACLQLRRNIDACINCNTNVLDSKTEDWYATVATAVAEMVELSVEAHFTEPGKGGPGADKRMGDGGIDGKWNDTVFSYYNFGAGCSVVELDCVTGQVQVLESDILYDCGKSMNPGLDIGQVEGAFLMGVGFYLHEEMLYTEEGKMATNGTWEYKPPSVADIPIKFNVNLLRDSPLTKGVLRSKAVGEPPQVLSYSVFSALRKAIAASRRERHLEPFGFDLPVPATVDRIQQVLEVADEMLVLE